MATQGQMTQAVNAALREAPLLPQDAAGKALVKRYAALMDEKADDPAVLADVGPKLLAALSALGMTPAGRGAKGGAQGVNVGSSKLDELRARRHKRAG